MLSDPCSAPQGVTSRQSQHGDDAAAAAGRGKERGDDGGFVVVADGSASAQGVGGQLMGAEWALVDGEDAVLQEAIRDANAVSDSAAG